MTKKNIAFLFGGRSPEHDVSIITGLQCLNAIDTSKYNVFPIYISEEGQWHTGNMLLDQKNYLFSQETKRQLTRVTLDVNNSGQGVLVPTKKKILFHQKEINFDVAFPAFHGLFGEDGQIQGLFELANIPYCGMRSLASDIFMDKDITKKILSARVPMLPHKLIKKPDQGYLYSEKELTEIFKNWKFPSCVKPCHLGSSIGVAKVNNIDELNILLPKIFKYDTSAIVEPFIENVIEYNIAVSSINNQIMTSAIEEPVLSTELLDFKQKYLSGEDNKFGTKMPGDTNEGMLSLTRTINPVIESSIEEKIRKYTILAFDYINGTGAPRVDFLFDKNTQELWFNEVNPFPGSLAYFLWEKAQRPLLFVELISNLIEEAIRIHKYQQIPKNPIPEESQIFKKR